MTMEILAPLGALRNAALHLDSGAQARTVSQLLRGAFPRHVLMEPILVPFILTMYLGLKPHMAALCRAMGTTGKSLPFRLFALVHNILLCSYSLWTATNVWGLTTAYAAANGTDALYCTRGLWKNGMHYWGFLFYLSKYWELIDTALLVWKGRSPSFLQVYHHTVTVICAYMLQASHASVTFIFVGLNSVVHAIMYFYYALTVIGVRTGAKSIITAMQIIQFLIGTTCALPMFFMRGGACATPAQKIAAGTLILHALYLTKLFARFYREAYQTKAKKA